MTIAINLAGPCLSTCDPPGGDLTHLALVTVSNTGAATAYLQACGTNPAMNEQLLVDGQWTFTGPAIACPMTPGPIVLAAGESRLTNWFFATGRRRIVLGVASVQDLSDSELAASAAVDVP